MGLTLTAARLFDGAQVHEPGLIRIDQGRVAEAGALRGHVAASAIDLGGLTIAPGFIDVHCHGGGGESFGVNPEPAIALHRAHGVTSVVASLVSQQLPELRKQLQILQPLVRAGELAGVHLEGPWIAPARKGAHPVEALRHPDPTEIASMLDEAGSIVRMITIAPELPGGLEAIKLMADRGVVAAIGHTDADYETAQRAIEAGATGATHLFNAMPELHHRHPGPILACTRDDRVWLELIADGTHVTIDLVAEVIRRHAGRVVLISDAMAAAGQADGQYRLGDLPVTVGAGVAQITGTQTIAGSTLTVDQAVRNVIAAGVEWQDAIAAATAVPASYLHLSDVGTLVPGAHADLITLDVDWRVRHVMRRGQWLSD